MNTIMERLFVFGVERFGIGIREHFDEERQRVIQQIESNEFGRLVFGKKRKQFDHCQLDHWSLTIPLLEYELTELLEIALNVTVVVDAVSEYTFKGQQ